MRLNIRLIGLLHGILAVGLIGSMLWRVAIYTPRSRDSKGAAPLILLGLALAIIGSIGTFFGKLIKAAVSRQREYLADAAAVQFTRNPSGIGGALRKIGARTVGSRLVHPRAEEASHMFFGSALKFSNVMATHPPLADRIRRIEPGWDGQFPEIERVRPPAVQEPEPAAPGLEAVRKKAIASMRAPDVALAGAVAQVGTLDQEHLIYAEQLLAVLPSELLHASRDPFSARAVICGLLLDAGEQVRERQWRRLRDHREQALLQEVERLAPLIDGLPDRARVALMDLAMPALREMSRLQYRQFKNLLVGLILADEQVDLFEWVLRRVILHTVEPHFEPRRRRAPHHALGASGEACAVLLSALAHVSHEGGADAAKAGTAFRSGAERLGMPGLELLPATRCDLRTLDAALDRLAGLPPAEKQTVLEACVATIEADRRVSPREGELLRAVAATLDCPMPPLLQD
jgi:hypothetical protein